MSSGHITMSATLTPSKFKSQLPIPTSPRQDRVTRPGIHSEPGSPEQPRARFPSPTPRPNAGVTSSAAYTGVSSYFPSTDHDRERPSYASIKQSLNHSIRNDIIATSAMSTSYRFGTSAAPTASSFFEGAVNNPRSSFNSDVLRFGDSHVPQQAWAASDDNAAQSSHVATAISFPKTRSVLWDSSPAGAQVEVTPTSVLPRVAVSRDALQALADNLTSNSTESGVFSFFVGHETRVDIVDGVDVWGRGSEGPRVFLEGCHLSSDDRTRGRRNDIAVTVLHRSSSTFIPAETLTIPTTEFESMIDELEQRLKSRQGVLSPAFFRTRLVACVNASTQSLALSGSLVCPSTALRFTPLNALRITPTTLARNLASQHHGGLQPQSGYLTMDATRKVLTLLDTDPMAYHQPVVGVWVSGVPKVTDVHVWASVLRFLHCDALHDRAMCNGRLLVLFYGTGSTLPQFYECEPLSRPLEYAHFRFSRNISLGAAQPRVPVSLHFHTPNEELSQEFTAAMRAHGVTHHNEDEQSSRLYEGHSQVSSVASQYSQHRVVTHARPHNAVAHPVPRAPTGYQVVASSAPLTERALPGATRYDSKQYIDDDSLSTPALSVQSSSEFPPARGVRTSLYPIPPGIPNPNIFISDVMSDRRGSAEAFSARFDGPGHTVADSHSSMRSMLSSASSQLSTGHNRWGVPPPSNAWGNLPSGLTNPGQSVDISSHTQHNSTVDTSTQQALFNQQQQVLQGMISQLMELQQSIIQQQQELNSSRASAQGPHQTSYTTEEGQHHQQPRPPRRTTHDVNLSDHHKLPPKMERVSKRHLHDLKVQTSTSPSSSPHNSSTHEQVEATLARTDPGVVHPRVEVNENAGTSESQHDTSIGSGLGYIETDIGDTVFVTQTPPGSASKRDFASHTAHHKRAPAGRRESHEPGPHSPYDEAVVVDFEPGSPTDPTLQSKGSGEQDKQARVPASRFTFDEPVSTTLPGTHYLSTHTHASAGSVAMTTESRSPQHSGIGVGVSSLSPARSVGSGRQHVLAAKEADSANLLVFTSPVRQQRPERRSTGEDSSPAHSSSRPEQVASAIKSSPIRGQYTSPIRSSMEQVPTVQAASPVPAVAAVPLLGQGRRHDVTTDMLGTDHSPSGIPRINYTPLEEETTEFESEVLYNKYLGRTAAAGSGSTMVRKRRNSPRSGHRHHQHQHLHTEHNPYHHTASPQRRKHERGTLYDYEENVIESTENLLSSLQSIDLSKLP